MHGISRVVWKRAQVGVGRGIGSILVPHNESGGRNATNDLQIILILWLKASEIRPIGTFWQLLSIPKNHHRYGRLSPAAPSLMSPLALFGCQLIAVNITVARAEVRNWAHNGHDAMSYLSSLCAQ